MSIKKGDNVRFLNAVGGGTVVRIDARETNPCKKHLLEVVQELKRR